MIVYILKSNFRQTVLSDWKGTLNFLPNTLVPDILILKLMIQDIVNGENIINITCLFAGITKESGQYVTSLSLVSLKKHPNFEQFFFSFWFTSVMIELRFKHFLGYGMCVVYMVAAAWVGSNRSMIGNIHMQNVFPSLFFHPPPPVLSWFFCSLGYSQNLLNIIAWYIIGQGMGGIRSLFDPCINAYWPSRMEASYCTSGFCMVIRCDLRTLLLPRDSTYDYACVIIIHAGKANHA